MIKSNIIEKSRIWQKKVEQKIVAILQKSFTNNEIKFFLSGNFLRCNFIGFMGNFSENLVTKAAIIELVHAASLLHDDIIDGDEFRRNLPAFWKKYGIKSAILFGDLVLIEVFSEMADCQNQIDLKNLTTSLKKVCCGEIRQTLKLGEISLKNVVKNAQAKTGELFGLAMQFIKDDLNYYKLGIYLGAAYQIFDDICDNSWKIEAEDLQKIFAKQIGMAKRIAKKRNKTAELESYLNQYFLPKLKLLKEKQNVKN